MPQMIDLAGRYTTAVASALADVTASGQSDPVDLQDQENGVMVEIAIGTVSGTSPTLAVKVQQSFNDNTASAQGAADAYTDVTGATLALTDADSDTVVQLMVYNIDERYVQLDYVIGGTSTPTFPLVATVRSLKKS